MKPRFLLLAAPLLVFGCAPERPARLPASEAAVVLEPELVDGVATLGGSWVKRVGPGTGVLIGRFEGGPYELGLAYGRLNRPRIAMQEGTLVRLFHAVLPNPFVRFGIRQLSAIRIRRLDRDIPQDLLVTIAGLADGYEPEEPETGWSAFRRMLDLHALHELSQRFIDAPGTPYACTGFLASGPAAHGKTLLARNFDFEGGEVFDEQKLVSVFAEPGKIPYLSVSFSGMLGVVSGFNREGIGVAINAIAGGETGSSGEPITIVLADLLAKERTLDGAIERLRRAKVFVSDAILLADGKTGELAVVEKTPKEFQVRRPGPERWMAVANAAKSAEVAKSADAPESSTSKEREARMEQLLRARSGRLDVPSAVAILRDTTASSGVDLGPGNRNAIDALIAAHSVVFDLGAKRAWVSAAPHTRGAYVPIDLEGVLAARRGAELKTAASIPADPFLASGAYDRYRQARRAIVEARRLTRDDEDENAAAALRLLEDAHRLSPEFAAATALLAEGLARSGERARALALADEALARRPGPDPFLMALERLADALSKGAAPPPERLPYVLEPDEVVALSPARDIPLAK
jgi:hypothetical protein